MHFVMNQIHSWAKREQRLHLGKWAGLARFQRLIAAVEQAIGSDHQVVGWHDQSAFFLSDLGARYRQALEEAELPIRQKYAETRWEVLR